MQARQIGIFFLAAAMLSSSAGFGANPVNKNQAEKTLRQKRAVKQPGRTSTQEYMLGVGEADTKNDKELINMIRGFSYLVKEEKSEDRKANYALSISSSYLALARYYRVKTKFGPQEKKNEATANERVLKYLEPVIASKKLDVRTKAKAAYYQGLAYINQGFFDKAQEKFLLSLNFHKESAFAPSISLYLAESKFEKEKYEEAINFYKAYFDRLTDQQKALSIYKTAWCYINIGDLVKAERFFISLIGKKASGSFGDDAVKDLAYLVTLTRNETQIIEFSVREFGKREDVRVNFLTEVFFYFQSQSGNKKKPILLAELLRIEKDPPKRFKILASSFRSSQKPFASMGTYEEFARIKKEVELNHFKPGLAEIKDSAAEIETEVTGYIKANYDTVIGKVKTPETIKSSEVFRQFEEVLNFHLYYFRGPDREKSYQVWISACDRMMNSACLYKVSKRIQSEKEISPELKKDADLMLLKALEQLAGKEPKYRDELIGELERFIASRQETEKEWKTAATKLTLLYNEKKEFLKSLPLLDKLHNINKNSESYFRLQFARFELGQFDELVKQNESYADDKFMKDARNLLRESHLKLATKAQETNQFDQYKAHLQAFLALKPDEAKADLARKNYIGQLIEKADWKAVHEEFKALPMKKRISPVYVKELTRSLVEFIKDAEFAWVQELLHGIPKESYKGNLGLLWLSSELAVKQGDIDFQGPWKDLTNYHRTYGLGILALTKPQKVIDSFQTKPPTSEKEKKLLLFSYQMRDKNPQPNLDPWAQKVLKGMVEGRVSTSGESSSEKKYSQVEFPKSSFGPKRYERYTQVAVESIRFIRRRVLKDVEKVDPSGKIRVLLKAIEHEKKMAEVIRAAPAPAGLDEAQTAEYKKGLGDLANEFDNQAVEFEKVKVAVEGKVKEDEKNRWPVPIQDQWPWPDKAWTSILREMVDKGNPSAALVCLDQRKSDESAGEEDYFQARSKILFSLGNHAVLSDYVKTELQQAKRDNLIAFWRKTFEKETP